MAIDYTGVTKIIKLDTSNSKTQTEIKRVYLGEDLQWEKPQSPYVWQYVHTGMTQPWTVGDLVCLVKFVKNDDTDPIAYYKNTTYSNNRFYFVRTYPNIDNIEAVAEFINNGITLSYDSVLGWCLSDDILPTQVNLVTRVNGNYAILENNYTNLGTNEPTDTSVSHYLRYKGGDPWFWWCAGTPDDNSSDTTFGTTYGITGTRTDPDLSKPKWWLHKSEVTTSSPVVDAWKLEESAPAYDEPTAQWGFFKRVKIAQ